MGQDKNEDEDEDMEGMKNKNTREIIVVLCKSLISQ